MKKNCLLVLAAALLGICGLVLAGCGGTQQATAPQQTLHIGIDADFAPYTYQNAKGEIVGLDAELAREAAKRLGRKAEFVPLKWSEKDKLLREGVIDCIWSCYSLDGREDRYAWSKAYMQSGQYVAIRTDSSILRVEDLAGKTIAAQKTTKFLEAIQKSGIQVKEVLEFNTVDECINAVLSQKADATGGHLAVMLDRTKNHSQSLEVLTQQPLSTNKIGVACRTGDMQTKEAIDKALGEMYKDGTTERIAARYLLSREVLLYE